MRANTLMFKKILVKIGVYMLIYIPELPDIELPVSPPIPIFLKYPVLTT